MRIQKMKARLRLINGTLRLANGDNPKTYLKKWASEAGVTSKTPVVLCIKTEILNIVNDCRHSVLIIPTELP